MSVENRLSRLEQKVNTIRGDQRTIFVDNLTSGITIRGKEVRQPVSGVGGGASTGYEGPWAVVKKVNTTNTVTVKASFLTGYYMSQIVGGLTTTYLDRGCGYHSFRHHKNHSGYHGIGKHLRGHLLSLPIYPSSDDPALLCHIGLGQSRKWRNHRHISVPIWGYKYIRTGGVKWLIAGHK